MSHDTKTWVEIKFECLPLRSVRGLEVPADASPKFAEKVAKIKSAIALHGTFNTYYLHSATCTFHLTNDPSNGMIEYLFEGTVFTDEADLKSVRSVLDVKLARENCSWLNQSIVDWLSETVRHAVLFEFDRYIAAGDLKRTQERLEKMEQSVVESGGFVGMYL